MAAPREMVSFRFEPELLERLDAIRQKLSRPGLMPTRTDVVRMALLVGLPLVEEREGVTRPKRKS